MPLPVNIYTIQTVMGTVLEISLSISPNLNLTADFFILAFPLKFLICIHFSVSFIELRNMWKFPFFSCMVWDNAKMWCLETSVENTAQTKALFWTVGCKYLNVFLACVCLGYRTCNWSGNRTKICTFFFLQIFMSHSTHFKKYN